MGGRGESRKGVRTTANKPVDQGLVTLEHILLDHLLPIVGVVHGQGVLEEVYVGPLVPLVAEKVTPVVLDDLGGRVGPRLEAL